MGTDSGRFRRGHAKRGGRKRGVPNKVTRAARELMAALCDDAEVQEAVKARILGGDTVGFFRALEYVIGRPTQPVAVASDSVIEFRWRSNES